MRDPRIRLLLHPELKDHERDAAVKAAARFKEIGLKAETLAGDTERVWKDRCRQQVFDLVFGNGKAVVRGEKHFYEPVYPVPNDGAVLAGVTVREIEWAGGAVFRGGFSLDGVGCVLSVAGLRPWEQAPYRGSGPADQAEAGELVKIALMKEIGHSMIGKTPYWTAGMRGQPPRYDGSGYCLSGACLLENTGDYLAYVRKVGAGRADFCAECVSLLKSRVIYIDSLGAA